MKKPKIKIFQKNSWFLKESIFGFFTPKKKFTYILVNGLMANFEFQRFWVEKVDFFPHGAPILPSSNPKFIYFYSLIILWKWVEFEKNRWLHSMGWFYTVALILGWSLTAVWVHWNQKYFGKFTYPNISLMGQSFIKIPDFVSETIFMTWKMCLLTKKFQAYCV